MTLAPPILGVHVLQRFVHAFGHSIVNAFDLDAWRRASVVERFGLRLVVRGGSVSVALRLVAADRSEREIATLVQTETGTAQGPVFRLAEMEGALMPVVTAASPGANFDILVVTDDPPAQPFAAVNYIICTFRRAAYVQHNAGVFRDYLRRWRDHARAAHLTVVDNGSTDGRPDCGVEADEHVTVLASDNTGGAGGFGRGIYATVHGALADRGFTHLCLMDDDLHLHPEMFARTTAFARFLRPGFHLGAPMYPTTSPDQAPARSACFGHRYRGSPHPSDQALGGGLDTADVAAFVAMPRDPETTGWWWDCIALDDIRRIGLPYPFFIKMDDVEYGLRLREAGVELVIPFSFWVLHDDFEEKYSAVMQYFRFRNRWVLLAQQGRLGEPAAFVADLRRLVREFVAARKYEHAQLLLDGMADFLAGPDHLVAAEKAILARVLAAVKHERNGPMPAPPAGAAVVNGLAPPASARTAWLNRATVNNHFLPLGETVAIDTARPYAATDCRRGRRVSYWNAARGVGFTVTRDSPRAAGQMLRLALLAARLRRQLPALAARYRARKGHLVSPAFWARYGWHGEHPRLAAADALRPHEADLMAEVARLRAVAGQEARRRTAEERETGAADLAFFEAIRNRFPGRRCFVLGNGPSLRIADLDRLHGLGEVTFASNKVYLCFGETRWRPTFYSCEDLLVAQNARAEIMALDGITKIFGDHMLRLLPRRPNHHYARWLPPADNRSPYREFPGDLTRGIAWGSTVTYSMLQMAVHMGFSHIYLIGVDHSYIEPSTRADGALVSEGERNHFHPDYRRPGERWHLPVLDRLETSYRHARDACAARGVAVWNASRATRLDVLARVDLDLVLASPPPVARPLPPPLEEAS